MWRGIKGRGTGGRGCRACAVRAASLGGTYAAGGSRAGADGERPGALADAARALGLGRACGPGPDGTAGDAGRQGPTTRAPGCRGRTPWSLPSAPGGGERETEPRAAAARAPSPERKGRQRGRPRSWDGGDSARDHRDSFVLSSKSENEGVLRSLAALPGTETPSSARRQAGLQLAGFFPARFPGQPPRARPPLGQPRVSPRTARKQKRCCVPFLPLDANKKSHHHVWSSGASARGTRVTRERSPRRRRQAGGDVARPRRDPSEPAPSMSWRPTSAPGKQASIQDAETRGPGARGTVGTRQTPLTTLRSLTVALQTLHPA